MSIEIKKLMKLHAISQCTPVKGQYLSSIFCIPKPDKSHRFILNLKPLNKFINPPHFKLEDIRTLCKLVTKDSYMCTLDIQNAYYLISIHDDFRKFLRFKYKGILYEFNCLPFGLSTAPYTFTKLLKPVVEHLRSQGLINVAYLDDLNCIGLSYAECLDNVHKTVNLLQCLGFIINMKKSNLIPSQEREYLGFVINTQKMIIKPTENKKKSLLSAIHKFLKLKYCSIREFAALVGSFVSICMAVSYGFVYTKIFEREKYIALQRSNGDYEKQMKINENVKLDLSWWQNKINTAYNPIKQYQFILEIWSDASSTGWGVHCDGKVARGFWSIQDKQNHINYLELLAAYFGLKCFAKDLKNCEILLRVDNTTAISYINRMGGVQYPKLNNLSRLLWQFCEKRMIWVFASYIKSKDNKEADFESRNRNIDAEWELSVDSFNRVVTMYGQPDIDLFASRINTKCIKYVSWQRDPEAWNIDAFTLRWSDFYFYAFPPFSVLLKTIQKIKNEKARGIIIFPVSTAQPWYPMMKSMIDSEVIYFPPSLELLSSPFRTPHPLHAQLTLGACILSGQRSN
ncbi:unnamed protein product [Parnassius mnemosyne]|uniref:Reverse transcriptase domain-containing protein n=1 Tax=Parnassius mnemosyne TaxID=213953 RepID=A0AAV1KHJ8_9NEOP